MGAPEGWAEQGCECARLWVRKIEENGLSVVESAWEPTPAELAALNAGGSIILGVVGGQPPVMLSVEAPPAEDQP